MLPDATRPGASDLSFEGPEFEEGPDEAEDLDDDELDDVDDGAGNRVSGAGDEEDPQDLGNRAPGGLARAVLEHVARSIVDEPDAVEIDVSEGRNGVRLSLHVSPSDMGRVIGRRGRVAQAIRILVRAAAAKEGTDAVVDIVDD
jgi:predicted RNA-binding protein YlqC (UPF0109 family)